MRYKLDTGQQQHEPRIKKKKKRWRRRSSCQVESRSLVGNSVTLVEERRWDEVCDRVNDLHSTPGQLSKHLCDATALCWLIGTSCTAQWPENDDDFDCVWQSKSFWATWEWEGIIITTHWPKMNLELVFFPLWHWSIVDNLSLDHLSMVLK